MKFLVFLLSLLLLSTSLYATYTPSFSLGGGANFTSFEKVDPSYKVRVTGNVNLELSLLEWNVGKDRKNRISLPIDFEYLSRSQIVGRRFLQQRLRFGFGFRYERDITSIWALGVTLLPGYTFFPNNSSGNLFLAMELNDTFFINSMLGIALPIRFVLAEDEFDFAIGVGIKVYFLGKKGKTEVGGYLIEN